MSTEAVAAGIVSDELIVLGRSRTEIGSIEHPVRRVTIAAPGPGRRLAWTDHPATKLSS